jgi:catalase (peroxidase I)
MNIRSIARKPFFDFMYLQPIMPQLLRIAMSDALTYNPNVENTGPKAHFNFNRFRKLKVNSGLNVAFKVIKEIKSEGNHVTELLSISDLIQIGGASAVEYCGGPFIDLKVGRQDLEDEHFLSESTSFPELEMTSEEIRSKYSSLGFSDELIVALFGYRTLGFLSNKDSEKEVRWTRNPWVFDNNYYEELLDSDSPYVKTGSDHSLLNDPSFRIHVEKFARNQNHFFDSFVQAYQKMSELGEARLYGENTSYLQYEVLENKI